MAILRVSDITGELIKDGSGAVLRIEFADSSRGAIEIDVSDEEVDRVLTTLGPLDPSTRRNGKAKAYTVADEAAGASASLRALDSGGRAAFARATSARATPECDCGRTRPRRGRYQVAAVTVGS